MSCFPPTPRLTPNPAALHTGYTHTWCFLSTSLPAPCSCLRTSSPTEQKVPQITQRLLHCEDRHRREGEMLLSSQTCHLVVMSSWERGDHGLNSHWTRFSKFLFSKDTSENEQFQAADVTSVHTAISSIFRSGGCWVTKKEGEENKERMKYLPNTASENDFKHLEHKLTPS